MPRLQTATCAALLATAMITATSGCSSPESADSAANGGAATVGEVSGKPDASAALQKWVDDLEAGDINNLVRKCWTIDPDRVNAMYADSAPILDAVTEPGVEGQFAYIWQNDKTRVSVKRSEVESGYACPYVSAVEDSQIYTEADAKYRVFRYLQRTVGNPVNGADSEADYPLECGDFSDTSRATIQGVLSYKVTTLKVSGKPDDYVVTADVLADGKEKQIRIRTTIEDEGYCLKSVE